MNACGTNIALSKKLIKLKVAEDEQKTSEQFSQCNDMDEYQEWHVCYGG